MISTVLCGRFYKIFVSPMLHKNPSQSSLRGIFRIDCLTIDLFCRPDRLRRQERTVEACSRWSNWWTTVSKNAGKMLMVVHPLDHHGRNKRFGGKPGTMTV